MVILYATCRNNIKQLLCTFNLVRFNPVKLHIVQRTFCFRNKEHMFYFILVKCNRPVRSIVSDRCWNLERARKTGIYCNFCCSIKLFCKLPFNITVGKYQILNTFFCNKRLFIRQLWRSKDTWIIAFCKLMILNMLNNLRGFLRVDDIDNITDKLFRIKSKLLCFFYSKLT